jgi:hypothetical protein
MTNSESDRGFISGAFPQFLGQFHSLRRSFNDREKESMQCFAYSPFEGMQRIATLIGSETECFAFVSGWRSILRTRRPNAPRTPETKLLGRSVSASNP